MNEECEINMLIIIIGFIFWIMILMLGYLIGEREGCKYE